MDEQPGLGVPDAASPPATPDFSTYQRESDARDLGRPTDTSTPAASTPAPSGDQSASTDATTAAGSAPAKPDDKSPRNLQTRKGQLDADVAALQETLRLRKALREELATLDRPVHAPPASEPAQPKATWERYKHLQGAPTAEHFDTYEDYLDARAEFIVDQQLEERAQRAAVEQQSHERLSATEQTITGFHARLSKAREADPAFDTKVDAGLLQIVPAFALRPGEPLRPANVLLQACVESEVSTALLIHFSTPEGQRAWNDLARESTPAAMLRAFGRLEARFVSSGSAAGEVPATPVTSAPAPPTVLGTKPPVSPDRVGAAVKAGDFGAYRALRDAEDLAVRRR